MGTLRVARFARWLHDNDVLVGLAVFSALGNMLTGYDSDRVKDFAFAVLGVHCLIGPKALR